MCVRRVLETETTRGARNLLTARSVHIFILNRFFMAIDFRLEKRENGKWSFVIEDKDGSGDLHKAMCEIVKEHKKYKTNTKH